MDLCTCARVTNAKQCLKMSTHANCVDRARAGLRNNDDVGLKPDLHGATRTWPPPLSNKRERYDKASCAATRRLDHHVAGGMTMCETSKTGRSLALAAAVSTALLSAHAGAQ